MIRSTQAPIPFRALLGLAVAASLGLSAAAAADDVKVPQIYSPEPTVDLGDVLQGEVVPHTFVVGNKGTADLEIRRVNPTCGCTVANLKAPDGTVIDVKEHMNAEKLLVLEPQQTCEVQVEFNSAGQPAHKHQKTIVVISSDDQEPALRLTMNVNVVMGVTVDPNPVQFGEVIRGTKQTSRTYAKLMQIEDLDITGIADKPEYIDVTWEKGQAPDGTKAIVIDITLLPNAPIGYVSTAVNAETNHPKMTKLPVQIYAHVKSDVVVDTGNKLNKERIDFEVIPFGTAVERTVEIINGNPAVPYKISGLEVESKHSDQIDVQLVTVEEGVHYQIKLTTSPELAARFFRGILKIRTEDGQEQKDVHFHGWVKKS